MKKNCILIFLLTGCFIGCTFLQKARAPTESFALTPKVTKKNVGSYEFNASYTKVFETSIRAIIEDYNLHILSADSGVITTDWDNYYDDKDLKRNKVSLLIKKTGWNRTMLTFRNHSQLLARQPGDSKTEKVWRPVESSPKEEQRIINNIKMLLGKPKRSNLFETKTSR